MTQHSAWQTCGESNLSSRGPSLPPYYWSGHPRYWRLAAPQGTVVGIAPRRSHSLGAAWPEPPSAQGHQTSLEGTILAQERISDQFRSTKSVRGPRSTEGVMQSLGDTKLTTRARVSHFNSWQGTLTSYGAPVHLIGAPATLKGAGQAQWAQFQPGDTGLAQMA